MKSIISTLSKSMGRSNKEVEDYLLEVQDIIENALLEDKITKINGLGTFKLQWVKPRKSVDVRNGESIEIAGHYKLNFIPEKNLKDLVNKPYSHLEIVNLDADDIIPQDELIQISHDDDEVVRADEFIDENNEGLMKLISQAKELSALISELESNDSMMQLSDNDEVFVEPLQSDSNESQQIDAVDSVIPETSQNTEVETSAPIYTNNAANIYGTGNLEDAYVGKCKITKSVLLIVLIVIIIALAALTVYRFVFNATNSLLYNEDTSLVKVSPSNAVYANIDTIVEFKDAVDNAALDDMNTTEVESQISEIKKIEPPIVAQYNASFVNDIFDAKRTYSYFSEYVTLNEGSRLVLIAEKYLGHKAFWVYIYEANMDVIDNPNNIDAGIMLRLPILSLELIDLNSDQCIKYANELQNHYVNDKR